MVDKDKQDLPAQAGEVPEKRLPNSEKLERYDWRKEKEVEQKNVSPDDERVSKELRREIEMMELDDNTKKEAEKKAQKIEFLGEKEKIEHLLQMAREKGVVFAIQVARKMNEPYLLDILHDTLAQEGFYLKMGKPTDDDNTDDDNKI
jgi:hypothetical protein